MNTAHVALAVSGFAGFVALYGAANAHRALRWQRTRDAERRAMKVLVLVEHFFGTWAGHGPLPSPGSPVTYRLKLSAINESEEAVVYVSSVSLVEAAGSGSMYLAHGDPDVRLEPQERAVYTTRIDETGDLELGEGFFAKVELTSGQSFQSAVEHLEPTLMHLTSERPEE